MARRARRRSSAGNERRSARKGNGDGVQRGERSGADGDGVGAVEKRALKADDADAGERFAAAAHVMGAAPGDLLTREGMRERYKVLVMGLHPSKRKCVGK